MNSVARPLYRNASEIPASRSPTGNAGLWFDKFCNQWRRTEGSWSMSANASEGSASDNPKLKWLQTLANGVGDQEQLTAFSLRQQLLVNRSNSRSAVFSTESRFVTGLGRSHPVENGFAWHPTLGTPYLPGSSIKGMVRSWVRDWAEAESEAEHVCRLLGKPGSAGAVCFLDAVPIHRVTVEPDVMTPHYAGWTPDCPPGDWRSPTPIPFLTTAAGTRFLFCVVPRQALAHEDIARVFRWLTDALRWVGAGAKTAVGYGRFREEERSTTELQKQGQDEQRRVLQEAVETVGGEQDWEMLWQLKVQDVAEATLLELVRTNLGSDGLVNQNERAAFAKAVLATEFPAAWRRGKSKSAVSTGKRKLKERVAMLDAAIKTPSAD